MKRIPILLRILAVRANVSVPFGCAFTADSEMIGFRFFLRFTDRFPCDEAAST